jgi:hypothetical protein
MGLPPTLVTTSLLGGFHISTSIMMLKLWPSQRVLVGGEGRSRLHGEVGSFDLADVVCPAKGGERGEDQLRWSVDQDCSPGERHTALSAGAPGG